MPIETNARAKISKLSLFGWIVMPLAGAFSFRLIYEELYLSIKAGPQLILYSFGHTSLWVVPMGLCLYALIAFVPLAIVRLLWMAYKRKRISMIEATQIVIAALLILPIFLPLGSWIRLRIALAGTDYDYHYDYVVAAGIGDLRLVQSFVSRGAPVDDATYEGRTPLDAACGNKHLEVARYLLSKGAESSLAPECDRFYELNGRTPPPKVPGTTIEVH